MSWINKSIRLIGLLLLVTILWKTDLSLVADVFLSANLPLVIVGFLISIIIIVLKTFRWRLILNSTSIHLPPMTSFIINFISVYLAKVTPGGVGDFVRISYLKSKGHPFGASFFVCFLDRLFDLFALFFFGFVAILFADDILGTTVPMGLLVLGLAIIAGVVLLLLREKSIIKGVYLYLVPKGLKPFAKDTYLIFLGHLRSLPSDLLIRSSLWSLVSWLVYYFQMQVFGQALGLHIDYFQFVIIMTLVAFIVMLPISIGGLGTREAALIQMMGMISIGSTHALGLAFLILANNLFVSSIGAVLWYIYPVALVNDSSL